MIQSINPLFFILFSFSFATLSLVRLTVTCVYLVSFHFSSKSTSIMSSSDFVDFLPRPFLEKKSPSGCHTMFPQPPQRIIWPLEPINSLLQAGQAPYTIPSKRTNEHCDLSILFMISSKINVDRQCNYFSILRLQAGHSYEPNYTSSQLFMLTSDHTIDDWWWSHHGSTDKSRVVKPSWLHW